MATYNIYTVEDWQKYLVDQTTFNSGDKYIIQNDIDFTDAAGRVCVFKEFSAILDGKGFMLKNIDDIGLFMQLSGTIKNVNFTNINCEKDVVVAGNIYEGLIHVVNQTAVLLNLQFNNVTFRVSNATYAGIVSGSLSCTIKGIHIDNYSVTYTTTNVNSLNYASVLLCGGRWDGKCTLEQISIRNSSTNGNQYIGIISGYHYYEANLKDISIVNCHVGGSANVATIFGRAYYGLNLENVVVAGCTVTSSKSSCRCASLCAYTSTSRSFNLTNVLIDCKILGTSSYAGNIFSSTAAIADSKIIKTNLLTNITASMSLKYRNTSSGSLVVSNLSSLVYLTNLGFSKDIWEINVVDNVADIISFLDASLEGSTCNVWIKINDTWVNGLAVYVKRNGVWVKGTKIKKL